MSTDETQGQEAPERYNAETEEEDTEGHVHPAMTGDPGSQELGVHPAARPDDEDDTEGHVKHSGA
jgi:hypothetical protein